MKHSTMLRLFLSPIILWSTYALAQPEQAAPGPSAVMAAPMPKEPMPKEVVFMSEHAQPSSVPGWDDLINSLRTLPERMLAKLAEAQRRDPQIRQEVARLALESLASQATSAIGADGDAPQFLPTLGQVYNIGQPNADTVYRSAAITPGGSYRIRGIKGTVNHTVLSQVIPQGSPSAGERPHLHLSSLRADAQGRFDVLISPEKPEGYSGDWWQLDPAARSLMVRIVSSDWAREVNPTLAIERVDKPVGRARPPASLLEQRLRMLPRMVDTLALMFVDHHEQLRTEGYINRFKVFDVGSGALSGQFYYEAAYDFAEDEALVVESPIPARCRYRSLILANELYETTDWYNNHASLNIHQADPDSDGKLRIVVAHRDPGVKNWLDTAGYPRGVVQGRWTDCDSHPMPVARVVKLKDLKDVLPADVAMVTADERQAILRERRRALLERPLW